MDKLLDTETFKNVPMSLPRIYVIALEQLAAMDGHTNRSAIVRKLVEREARECLGEDWNDSGRDSMQAVS